MCDKWDHLFRQTGALKPTVKTCIVNCAQMVPDTTVVCIDINKYNTTSPYRALQSSTHTGNPSIPEKRVV